MGATIHSAEQTTPNLSTAISCRDESVAHCGPGLAACLLRANLELRNLHSSPRFRAKGAQITPS